MKAFHASLLVFLAFLVGFGAPDACVDLSECSGHGTCISATKTCSCYDGWGSDSDISGYKSPDCSTRVCPSDRAWVDVPTAADTAHALAECSNAGLCETSTGVCSCFSGFEGEACQRISCPDSCSGHGKCVSIKEMAEMEYAYPVSSASTYGGSPYTTTWDEDKIYGCVCDSSWEVGVGAGDTQMSEYFGANCAYRHCPSGNDPMTSEDETDCEGKRNNGADSYRVYATDISFDQATRKISSTTTDLSGFRSGEVIYVTYGLEADNRAPWTVSSTAPTATALYVDEATLTDSTADDATYTMIGTGEGASGNLCHVDCSNRGLCDYSTGICTCFSGYYGENCNRRSALASSSS